MSKRLIVGLGNPGPEYASTRHNVGFMVADRVAERARINVRKGRDDALSGWGRWRGRELGVAKPQTWMNRSGLSVDAMVRRWKLDLSDLLIVVDDIHLPLGTIRVRPGGGTGGHNGLEDIIDWLDSNEFPRLRIGIGGEFDRGGQSDYVLSPFESSEEEVIAAAIDRSVDACLTFITDGVQVAMNRFNT